MFILRAIYNFFVDTIQTFLLVTSILLLIYFFIARPFQVKGSSMYPTFKDREYIFTNIIGLHFSEPKRGDVIVFKSPIEKDKDFIKRIIGLPGDSISLHEGFIYVNGKKLDESAYLNSYIRTPPGQFLKEGETIKVPKDSYFVMGDNRSASSDSRDWGVISKKEIIGISFYVYWPLNSIRKIDNPFYVNKK